MGAVKYKGIVPFPTEIRAEVHRLGLTSRDLAAELRLSSGGVRSKLAGFSPFTVLEQHRLRQFFARRSRELGLRGDA